jgi:hypothetical protein
MLLFRAFRYTRIVAKQQPYNVLLNNKFDNRLITSKSNIKVKIKIRHKNSIKKVEKQLDAKRIISKLDSIKKLLGINTLICFL